MIKKAHSFYDKTGKLYVDCTECKRGWRGARSCSAGWCTKRPEIGGCFSGELMEGITPRVWDLKEGMIV